MNIGIDIRSLLEKERSGVGEYTYELLNAIFDIDKENQYYLFYNSFKKVEDNFLVEWKKYQNVHFCGFRWPNKLLNFCFKFLRWPKIDRLIVHSSWFMVPLSPSGRGKGEGKLNLFFIPNLNFLAVSRGVKKIITIHDLSFLRYPRFFSWKRRLWHRFVNPQKLIRGADKIIAVSENTKRDLVELYKVVSEKVGVICSGVTPHLASPPRGEEIAENLPRPSGERVGLPATPALAWQAGVRGLEEVKKKYNLPENFILFLGTLEPRKNIKGLIRAFEIFKQSSKFQVISYKLVIVGPRGWLCKRILARAEKSPVRDDIKFINYISPEEKFAFYKLARLFVYPSFYEGFGFPPLEAAQVGTPVIVSTNSSLPEVMGEAALMVDPYNPAEMAKAMAECLTDENLRKSLVEKGKKQAEKFSLINTANEFLSLIRQ
ncbi:glycosyltransferase family 4 protein [Candidatus Falkowbacteria bacterium]|nr:glycosyltransferase family 4 protein [Candidatus Falkowbacteria bacterium]